MRKKKNIYKWLRFKTIRANLFFYYSVLTTIVLVLSAIFLFSYLNSYISQSISNEQKDLGMSIANSLDNEMEKLNTISMNISYSNLIKKLFSDYLYAENKNGPINPESYNNMQILLDGIMAIIGPFQTVSQVNLFNMEGRMIGSGLYNEEAVIQFTGNVKFIKALALDGYKYIHPPERIDLLSSRNKQIENHFFISLLRVYKNSNYQTEGIVEVLQDCEDLFKFVNMKTQENGDLGIFIIDNDNQVIYPYLSNQTEKALFYQQALLNSEVPGNQLYKVTADFDKITKVVSYTNLDSSDWKIIIAESEKELFRNLNNFKIIFVLFFLLILTYTIVISFWVSFKITDPLEKVITALGKINLENFMLPEPYEKISTSHSLNEINTLYNAFDSMAEKLKESLSELFLAKNQEMNARLLALQSQMNPHFLYNNLSNISAMAEAGMTKAVVEICHDISDMLRYINTKNTKGVKLIEEIEYTRKFLACMKIRYESDLEFRVNIPSAMDNIIVPKIILQPLVENSIKHGFNNDPPWRININGKIENNSWVIEITDNGRGFEKSVISYFCDLITNKSKFIENHELFAEKLGLRNTLMRLVLLYMDNAVIGIRNNSGGGAWVKIGGPVDSNNWKIGE